MPSRPVNRRHFLGCSAAAGLALAQGQVEAAPEPVRIGLIGLGNRGTTLLRSVLAAPAVQVAAVADPDPRARTRAVGIAEKATGRRPADSPDPLALLARDDLDAVVVAVPCDLHAPLHLAALRAGRHLYAEKPLGLSAAECDAILAEAEARPDQVAHVGHQRRLHPRYQAAVALAHSGALGRLVEFRGRWSSSNGPVEGQGGWLGRRERSGDWMLEQAVHVWDLLAWLRQGPPELAFGTGHRDLFRATHPDRDVTDFYNVQLAWADGFTAAFTHSWIAPADDAFTGLSLQILGTEGGVDLNTGTVTYRDRTRGRDHLPAGAAPDTDLALAAFFQAIRDRRPAEGVVTLAEARRATQVGLLVREAVDRSGVARWSELFPTG
jgi:predicted dehydrogenase